MTRFKIALGTGTVATAVAAGMIVYAPVDDLQGIVQKLFYLHVSSLIAAYGCFAVVAGASIYYLWRGSRRADRLAQSAVPVGLILTSVGLLMGIAWAQPVWGWNPTMAWDARFTSTVVLWAVYAGYLMVRSLAAPARDAARLGAIVGIIGFLDVPISYFSVQWWRGLHPGPVLEASGGPALPAAMLVTFLVTMAATGLVTGVLTAARYRLLTLEEELELESGRRPDPQPQPVAAVRTLIPR